MFQGFEAALILFQAISSQQFPLNHELLNLHLRIENYFDLDHLISAKSAFMRSLDNIFV